MVMWPFSRRVRLAAVEDDRIATLSRRLDDAESKVRGLTTEWLDTLERIERVLGRMVKRSERAVRAGSDPAPANGAEEGAAGLQAPSSVADEVAVRRSRLVNPARR